jgi:hypothetical protein
LLAITKELSLHWEETRSYWRDSKSQEFEHQYMEQLVLQIERAVTVGERLDKVINKVRSECE